MKINNTTQLISLMSFVLIFLYVTPTTVYNDTPQHAPILNKPIQRILKRPVSGDLRKFMNNIGKVEGLGNYATVGGFKQKYLGLYQFHLKTLQTLGITTTAPEFLNNPTLQDSAMILYMKDNANDLKQIIKKYNNTYVNGIFITKSGILAGAHLVGSAGVMAFFYPEKFSYRTTDGNGVHVSVYMTKFANYNLRGI